MKESKVRFSDIKDKKADPVPSSRERQNETRKPAALRPGGYQSLHVYSQKRSSGIFSKAEPNPEPKPEQKTEPNPESIKDSEEISHGTGKNKEEKADVAEAPASKAVYHGDLRRLLSLEASKRNPADSVPEDIPGIEPPVPEEEEPLKISFLEGEEHRQIYAGLEGFLRQVKAKVQNSSSFRLDEASAVIARIVESPGLLQKIYALTIPIPHGGDYNVSHQVNTMIYAVKIGVGFSLPARKLRELALSALFHDIGMFLIPEEVTNKDVKLNSDDLAIIRKHPVLGRDILSAFDQCPWLSEVAYQHHERENGQGYPLGLKGDQISEYAKIIGIVDSYEAMTHNRPYRKALMQAFSAQELIKAKNLLFSPMVIKVFLQEISIYPLGSYVRLNNRAIGQVVGTDQTRPLRPDVRIIFDGEGNPVEKGSVIKLDENPIFFIQDSVSEEELPNSR